MTQQERILLHLQDEPTCGTSFLNWHIPRYAARIHELRAKGHQITSERCQIEYHHHLSPQTVYTLARSSTWARDVRVYDVGPMSRFQYQDSFTDCVIGGGSQVGSLTKPCGSLS